MTDWMELDNLNVWHPYATNPVSGPKTIFHRAKGAYVYDERGKGYLDATSSWWCNIHGHCHPRLVEALRKQAGILDHVMCSPHGHPNAVELATRLLEKLNIPGKVFYSDDGSTANEAALKMAVQYWQYKGKAKNRFVALERAYHGDTLGAVSVSHVAEFHRAFEGLMMPVFRLPVPHNYRRPDNMNVLEYEENCYQKTKEVIETNHNEIAAFIAEPLIQGAGGMIIYSKDYLEKLITLCQAHDILVIFDEVFTGFGRTGTMFASDQIRKKADIICLSKGLTAGMLPMAATVVKDFIFDEFMGEGKMFPHGHTFTGSALACAIGIESLKIFDEENVISRNQALIDVMRSQRNRFIETPWVGDVRQLGMIWAMELVKDKTTKSVWEVSNKPGWNIATSLWENGYWLRPLHNIFYVVSPYCTSEKELSDLFDALYVEVKNEKHFNF